MVNNCTLCKKVGEPLLRRGLHRFPKDETYLSEWKRLTGVEKVYNSTLVCSEHFKDDDLKNNNSKLRKLKPTAVPSLNLPIKIERLPVIDYSPSNGADNNLQNTNAVGDTGVGMVSVTDEKFFDVYEPMSNEADNNLQNIDAVTDADVDMVSVTDEVHVEQHGLKSNEADNVPQNADAFNDTEVDEVPVTEEVNFDEYEPLSTEADEFDIIQELDGVIYQTENTDWDGNPNRKLNGICRNDFKTNEAWLIYRENYFDHQRKMKNLKEQLRRRDIFTKKMKTYVDELKKDEFNDSSKYLEELPFTLQELVTRIANKPASTVKYSPELKSFSIRWRSYSAANYDFLRKQLKKNIHKNINIIIYHHPILRRKTQLQSS